jgi:hypothetical protein
MPEAKTKRATRPSKKAKVKFQPEILPEDKAGTCYTCRATGKTEPGEIPSVRSGGVVKGTRRVLSTRTVQLCPKCLRVPMQDRRRGKV